MDAVPPADLEPPTRPTVLRPPRRFPPWTETAGLAVYAVLAWLCLLSFPQGLPLPTLDLSWSAIVAKAGAERWEFGRQIMLNYGPWAHLGIGFYYAPLFTTNYVFQLASKAVLVALFCRVGRALPRAMRWPFLVANLATGLLAWEYAQTLAVVYAGWLTSEDRTRAGRVIGGAGIVLAAAAGMMKTFYIVFGHGVLFCVLARQVLRGRGRRQAWFPGLWPLGLFEGCLGLNWWLAGQRFADLPAYLHGTLALTDGHSRVMGFDPPLTVFLVALALFAWTGGLGVVCWRREARERRVAALPLAALFLGSLFMAWKQGVTRADHFHLSGYFCFVAVLITTLPLFFDRRTLAPYWHGAGVFGVWTLAAAATVLARPEQGKFLAHELTARPAHNLSVLFAPGSERARLDARVAEVRARFSLPATRAFVGRERIDCFGTVQGLLLLNDLNYAPVPTLQGYMAYPPYLAGIDVACYEPGRAPAFVLYRNDPIDDHWLTLDGALQLREILWNYQLVLSESRYLLLRRKPAAACLSPRPVLRQQGEIALDTPLPLPADGADWCELEVHRTLLGRLVNFFYHEPKLIMATTTRNGLVRAATLPPVMARGGFLLRQPPRTNEDLAHLLDGQPVDDPVTSIRLDGDALLRAAVGEMVTYRFYHLDPPRPSAP